MVVKVVKACISSSLTYGCKPAALQSRGTTTEII